MINMHKLDSQKGTGLVEVLVSLLILAISILGYVAVQGNALQLTDESTQRTQSLVLMRDIGERIRMNPNGVETYKTKLNASGNATPAKGCGLFGTSTDSCTPIELAVAEAYIFKKEMKNSGYKTKMVPCPSTGGMNTDAAGNETTQNASNIMFSYCLISAWGDTTPTVGADDDVTDADGDMDCLTPRSVVATIVNTGGAYHPGATCMLMELT